MSFFVNIYVKRCFMSKVIFTKEEIEELKKINMLKTLVKNL